MIKFYLFLSTVFILFLSGCNGNEENYALTLPVGGVAITIEYFDKNEKGYLLLKGGSEEHLAYLNESMSVEILSFIDDITGRSIDDITGLSHVEAGTIQTGRNLFTVAEAYDHFFKYKNEKDKVITRHYTLKYKVTSIKGDFVEEIKAISTSNNLLGATFTEVWYNGKIIPIMTKKDVLALYPPEDSPDRYDWEVYERVMKESYYNGDLIAILNGSSIYIVLPFERR